MASVIRTEAAKALATYLADYVAGNVTVIVGQPGNNDAAKVPAVTILPGQFGFTPFNSEVVDGTSFARHALITVGEMEGEVEIRAVANYKPQRATLEENITQAFLANELSPGNINLPLGDCDINGVEYPPQLVACFDLDDATWREEQVFSDIRYSYMTVKVTLLALVSKDYPTIDTLQLALTEDMDSDAPDTETVTVDEDGDITPA